MSSLLNSCTLPIVVFCRILKVLASIYLRFKVQAKAPEKYNLLNVILEQLFHTGKCIRRFGGIYAYCRYFKDRKW